MKILSGAFIALILLIILLLAIERANSAAAERAHARAAVIRAQSQARLDASAAYLPYVAIAVSTAFASSLVALGVALVVRADVRREYEARVIERQVVVLVGAGSSRREVLKMIGGSYETYK